MPEAPLLPETIAFLVCFAIGLAAGPLWLWRRPRR